MSMNESLEDTGGHYYDAGSGGYVGTLRKNLGAAMAEVRSGDAGKAAVGTAAGFGVIMALKAIGGD